MDIRGFFGSTKKKDPPSEGQQPKVAPPPSSPPKAAKSATTKSPAVKPVASSSKKKRKEDSDDDEVWLADSDDDEIMPPAKSKSRKKLKSASMVDDSFAEWKESEDTTTTPQTSSSKKRSSLETSATTPTVDLTGDDAPAKASGSSAKKQRVTAEDNEPVVAKQPTPKKTKTITPKKSVSSRPPPAPPAVKIPGMHFIDLKIAVSGVFATMNREAIEEYIKERGGKISSAVSGKTDFLVVGHTLEDGRPVNEGSKHRAAVEKKVEIIEESEFFEKYPPVPIERSDNDDAAAFIRQQTSVSSTMARIPSVAVSAPLGASLANDLWVDKYRPRTVTDLIGHGELANKLSNWLRSWNNLHLNKAATKPSYSKENAGAKAVLLSGPPGIGKTSVAGIIAREQGYEILELNASDTRNKREIDERLVEAVSCHAISMSLGGQSSSSNSSNGQVNLAKRLVIMDEVDGMGGSDRGGIQELIKVIKVSRIPIICICNDRQSVKVKSLANHCFDLRVKRPTKTQIATRLVAIARQERLMVDLNAAEILVEQAGNDIRAALNALQMWAAVSTSTASTSTASANASHGNAMTHLGYTELKNGLSRIEKDKVLRLSPFDACLSLMSGAKTPWEERYNAFFVDYSLIPLLVQENYIDSAKNGIFRQPISDDMKMQALQRAAHAVSDMDMIGSRIRGLDQHWELLPAQAALAMRVGSPIQGFQAFPSFPQWLGKYSSTNRKSRLTRELVQHSSLAIGQGFLPIRLDYVSYIRNRLLQPLLSRGKEGVEEVIAILDEYGFTKDDFSESMKDLQFTLEKPSNPAEAMLKDHFDAIDSQTKAALTRQYNSGNHMSQTAVQPLAVRGAGGKKKKAAKSSNNDDDEVAELLDDEGEASAEEENNGEEEEDVEALRAALSKSAGKSSKASAAKANKKAPAASSSKAAAKKK